MPVYTEEKKLEILNYVKEHGLENALGKFKISPTSITGWNKKYNIYDSIPQYTEEKKLEILNYAKKHGVGNALEKFKISPTSIARWNKKHNIYDSIPRYSKDEILKILSYAKQHGVVKAAKKFNTSRTNIARWNKKHNIFKFQATPREYSENEKLKILNYAKKHGAKSAAEKFNTVHGNITAWNRKHNIYKLRVRATYSKEEKQVFLNEAAANGITITAKKYDILPCLLTEWNKAEKYKFWNPRKNVTKAYDKEFILEVLKYAKRYSPGAAARTYNISSSLVSNWNRKYKIYKKIRNCWKKGYDFSPDEKEAMLKIALEIGYRKAAENYDINGGTLVKYNFDIDNPILPARCISPEENELLLEEAKRELELTSERERQIRSHIINHSYKNEKN